MSKSRPRAGGPRSLRTFTPAEKLRHLAAYEVACQDGLGGGYLRREGLYSLRITEWRKLRDGGVLEGREPGAKIGRLSAEQAEIARLRTQLTKAEQRLARTEVALQTRQPVDLLPALLGHDAELAAKLLADGALDPVSSLDALSGGLDTGVEVLAPVLLAHGVPAGRIAERICARRSWTGDESALIASEIEQLNQMAARVPELEPVKQVAIAARTRDLQKALDREREERRHGW